MGFGLNATDEKWTNRVKLDLFSWDVLTETGYCQLYPSTHYYNKFASEITGNSLEHEYCCYSYLHFITACTVI